MNIQERFANVRKLAEKAAPFFEHEAAISWAHLHNLIQGASPEFIADLGAYYDALEKVAEAAKVVEEQFPPFKKQSHAQMILRAALAELKAREGK